MREPSPRPIRVLPPALANQIAAGEVVERPASVAKELLENSLDAGARRIRVDAEGGGVRLIRVRDDGQGMQRDELTLALARHATSKIGSLEELEHVRSLGFRGEALPSIAAVSRLTLTSRGQGAEAGWQIAPGSLDGDASPQPAAHPPGTTVEVRDLFFNTPARRKFLRTERTELRHLEDVLRRIALSRAELGVALYHNQRQVFAVGSADDAAARARRVAQLCGRSFVEAALELDFESADLRLHGFLGAPGFHRAQADVQHFFVNGRMVRDSLVSHAVRQAFQGLLPQGRHPAYVLYLALDPAQVDVNVHPAKHEVRFREGRLVHDFVFRSLHRALGGPQLIGAGSPSAPPLAPGGYPAGTGGPPQMDVHEQLTAYRELHPSRHESATAGAGVALPAAGLGRALAEVGARYVIAESDTGLILVNVRAARRQLCFERLREGSQGRAGVRAQPLLLPASVCVGEAQATALERAQGWLRRLGFDLGRTGPQSVCLRALPAPLRRADMDALVRTLAASAASAPDIEAFEAARDEVLWCLAEHAGLPERGASSLDELNSLLRELEARPAGERTCRGGDPIWARLDLHDLERLLRGGAATNA